MALILFDNHVAYLIVSWLTMYQFGYNRPCQGSVKSCGIGIMFFGRSKTGRLFGQGRSGFPERTNG
ncbi:hypothetical protein DO021_18910 [Desulfobacter hydrogenophilus]|uniref:Uncharacterized protein n=1 Tax=Desulfobacter hydrogenophilus TaxID=2291 RepID=A0A328F8C2_9BACT|nr:hypothetical protein DO021_18910 [Desulfobacter hydrogenophilus]